MRHEQLWAPWRLGYIQGTDAPPPPAEQSLAWLPGADPQCFLCRGVAAGDSSGKAADRQNLIVGRTELSVVMLNRYPYNNGHLLIAPLLHKGRLDELEDAEHLDCQQTLARCIGLLERELQAEAFNIGLNLGRTAGAGLPGHLHWHIVPRWNGDTNFMATMAGIRVIPQALDALWEVLDAAWRSTGSMSLSNRKGVLHMASSDAPAIAPGMHSVAERERALLAPYALHSSQSAGRKYPEPEHPYRGPFQRDRDRIVHTSAYRRLSFKTQVFTGELGDYHRTRLTHTLEVASVSRTVGRALGLNEDLIEALALVHDLGHPPFGHAGEDVLDRCLAAIGGFSHNQHALRLVEELETRYHRFSRPEFEPRDSRRAKFSRRQDTGRAAPCWRCRPSRRPTASPTTRTMPTTPWSWACSIARRAVGNPALGRGPPAHPPPLRRARAGRTAARFAARADRLASQRFARLGQPPVDPAGDRQCRGGSRRYRRSSPPAGSWPSRRRSWSVFCTHAFIDIPTSWPIASRHRPCSTRCSPASRPSPSCCRPTPSGAWPRWVWSEPWATIWPH